MSIARASTLLASTLASAVWLTGCGSAQPVGHHINLSGAKPVTIESASFKLDNVRLQWQDNPAFNVRMTYTTSRTAPQDPSKVLTDRRDAYMKQLIAVCRDNTVPALTSELLRAGASFGDKQVIVVTPISGYFDTTGWNNGVVMRATVLGEGRKALWSVDIDSRSGITWLGGGIAPAPDDSFAKNYARSLVETMRKAGLIA